MTERDRNNDRGTATTALRIAGTVLLTLATSVVYAGGLWAAWTHLFSNLASPLDVVAMLGAAVAPFALVGDVVSADRADRDERNLRDRGKDEIMD